MKTLKLATMRALTWVALKGRMYSVWSKLYRFMFEHKHVGKHLIPFSTVKSVRDIGGAMTWRRDTWLMLFDAISHPVATLKRHTNGKSAGDCDDISLFMAQAFQDMMDVGLLDSYIEVGLLSIPWMERRTGEIGGHNVCVFKFHPAKSRDVIKWAHVSNWYGAEVSASFDSLQGVIKDVLGADRLSLGWAYWDVNLKLREYGRGKLV